MGHQGVRLRKFFMSNGISFAKAHREIGVNKNTIHKWMEREVLPNGVILRVAGVYSGLKEYFPEVDWLSVTGSMNDSELDELRQMSDISKARVYEWQKKYLELMTRYNDLLEKHTAYLEDSEKKPK